LIFGITYPSGMKSGFKSNGGGYRLSSRVFIAYFMKSARASNHFSCLQPLLLKSDKSKCHPFGVTFSFFNISPYPY